MWLRTLWACIGLIVCTQLYADAGNTQKPQKSDPVNRSELVLSATDFLGKDTYTHHPYTELLRAALDQLGYNLKVVHNPGVRSLSMANRGVVDGELLRIRDMSDKYPNLIMVPEPLGRSDLALYVKLGEQPASGRWQDFSAHTLVDMKGLAILDYLPAKFHALNHIRAQNYYQAIHLLLAGRADLILLPTTFVEKADNAELAAQLSQLNPLVGKVEGFTHLHKRHAHLVEPLAEALRRVKATSSPPPAGQ